MIKIFNKIVDKIIQGEKIIVSKEILENINFQDESKMSLLAYAVNSGNIDAVKTLLEYNASPNLVDEIGNTPVIEASLFGLINIVQILLGYSININHQNNLGETAISAAASNGHIDIVKLLIDHNADINIKDNMGTSPRDWAKKEGYSEIIKLLLVPTPSSVGMHTRITVAKPTSS
jgi:hypothetical protein